MGKEKKQAYVKSKINEKHATYKSRKLEYKSKAWSHIETYGYMSSRGAALSPCPGFHPAIKALSEITAGAEQ